MTRIAFMTIMLTSTLTGVLLAHEVKSQNISETKVSLNLTKVELRNVFLQLEKQSGFRFYYDEEIGSMKGITLKENTTLDVVLKKLANLKHLRFTQENSLIAVTKSPLPPPPPPPGSIKGRVVEFETSEPLPGATVRIVELNRGIASDEKGFYHFNNIPPGKYTLQVSFIGFETYQQSNLEVKEDKELTLDIKLKASSNLSEVVIKSKQARSKQAVSFTSDKELIDEIKGSDGVVSGISNEQIVKSADRNAAEVVKRISGVTVVDDRFIVVRGMNERYNLTYLNGNVAPSTEFYVRAFAYDLLPSSIIDRILVYKSPQADLLGDFAGGAVKVFTKNAKPVRHFDIGVQLAHRPGSTLTDVNSYKGGKYDFLGFDDGTRKLPSFSPSYYPDQNFMSTPQSALLKGFSPILDYSTKKSLPDMQLYANYYDNWKIGRARLYDLTSVNYTHETRDYNVYNQVGNTYYEDATQSYNYINDGANTITYSQQTTEVGKINILENFTLKLNKNNQLEFKNFFLNEGRKLTTLNNQIRNIDPLLFPLDQSYRENKESVNLSFQQRLLYSGNIGGTHGLGHGKQELDWNLGYTYALQNIPDQRNSTFINTTIEPGYNVLGTNNDNLGAGFLGGINRIFTRLNENAYNASVDYSFHLIPQFTVKAGTYQLYKTRDVGRRFFRVNRAGLQPYEVSDPYQNAVIDGWIENGGLANPNLTVFHRNELNSVWSEKFFPNDGSGLAIYDATSQNDSYVASEQNNSGYIMGDWVPFHKMFTINAGMRVEYDRQKTVGTAGYNGAIFPIKSDHPKTSYLPSVQINYRPDSSYVVRASYGRTVNRPDFREIAPYTDYDFQNNQEVIGNPKLTSATIENYDIRVEFYPQSATKNELFNVGAFYKTLQNPIEQLRVSKSGLYDGYGFTDITYGNAVSAKVYGLEAEVKKSLSFIGLNFFHDLSVVANGAIIRSRTQQRDFKAGYYALPGTNLKGRPLQGQSPYVLNTGLYYENPASGTKVSLIYNVNGARIYAKSSANPNSKVTDTTEFRATRPDLLQLSQKLLDFSVTQRIVKSLQLKFSVQNILNQSSTIVEDHNYNQKYDPEIPHKTKSPLVGPPLTYYTGDNIFRRYNPGRYFILQLTYAF